MKLPARWKKNLKAMGVGTIVFFTVKGIITTSLILGAAWGLKSCF